MPNPTDNPILESDASGRAFMADGTAVAAPGGQILVRPIYVLGDAATFANVLGLVPGGQASGAATSVPVALIPGQSDLADIKELLFRILAALTSGRDTTAGAPQVDGA